MAEKEERIWIEFDIPKPKGAIEATRCTTMTRQEAINRMAKAIKSVPKASGEAVHSTDYVKWAEAALNALLESEK